MKRRLLGSCAACILGVQIAQAGTPAAPVIEPEIVVEEAASSSSDALIPLLLLVLLVGLAITNDGATAPTTLSDARLKTDIVPVGTAPNGLTLYHFRYIGLPTVYEGVMAQEVLAHDPDAVVPMPFGFMAVDYGRLGLEMRVVH